MSCFKKVLLLLSIVGGINWGIYGIWGFNAVGWLLGGSMSWLSRTVFIIVGLSSLCLIPGLFMADPKQQNKGGRLLPMARLSPPPPAGGALRARTPLSLARHLPTLWGVTLAEGAKKQRVPHGHPLFFIQSAAFPACCGGCSCRR